MRIVTKTFLATLTLFISIMVSAQVFGAECSTITDWTTAATEDGWSCSVDGTEYEYADFHVLISNNEDLCYMEEERDSETSFPTQGPDSSYDEGKPDFCHQNAQKIHALFDWDNEFYSPSDGTSNVLGWLRAWSKSAPEAKAPSTAIVASVSRPLPLTDAQISLKTA